MDMTATEHYSTMHFTADGRDRYRTSQHMDFTADGCDRYRTSQYMDITADGRDRYRTSQHMNITVGIRITARIRTIPNWHNPEGHRRE